VTQTYRLNCISNSTTYFKSCIIVLQKNDCGNLEQYKWCKDGWAVSIQTF